jgi:hypothetical protein
MECVPAARVAVVNVPLPLASVAVPSMVVPPLNVTVPLGIAAVVAVGFAVAVNVTDLPYTDGFNDDTNDVEV